MTIIKCDYFNTNDEYNVNNYKINRIYKCLFDYKKKLNKLPYKKSNKKF